LSHIHKIFGPPGSGKTTYLLSVVEKELESGVPASSIGYFSFTKKAANEARDRAITKFPTLDAKTDFPWFRTLHSLAFRCLNITANEMMKAENYREFSKETGIEINIENGEEEFMVKADNPILSEINIARIKGEDLRAYYNCSNIDIEWHHFEYVERAYRHYKESRGLIDFTDMLERIVCEPQKLPTLQALIIDEAQDLSRLQWNLVEILAGKSQRVYIAGDDDQAVFTWAGADVEAFLNFEGKVTVLEQSWRVPAKVHAVAEDIVQRIRHRQAKEWKPRNFEGAVQTYQRFEDVDVTSGEWLVLASTNYLLNEVHGWLKSLGVIYERHGHRSVPENMIDAVFTWEQLRKGLEVDTAAVLNVYKYLDSDFVARGHKRLPKALPDELHTIHTLQEKHGLRTDVIWHEALTKISEDKREYIIAALRRGRKLRGNIPVKLSTIHGAKGGEADHVMLLTDLSSRFANEYATNSDSIHRMFYVGVTRAKKSLHIVLPKNTNKGFQL
jgi:DNA helicase-2/ATP-dependent DNA helicase PcrA